MKKILLSLLCLVGFTVAQAETTWSYTFVKGDQYSENPQTKTFNEVSWSFEGVATNKDYWGWDGNTSKGIQFGSAGNPYTAVTLTASFADKTISSITINTCGASSINATMTVTVGGIAFTCGDSESISLTKTATDYTFTGSGSGDLVFAYTNNSAKAIYIKSISVTYTDGATEIKQVAKPVITPNGGKITADTEITISCATENAAIYYTTNGDEPSAEATLYTGAFTLDADATVKAIGILDGYDNSSVAQATFTIPEIAKFGYVKTVASGKNYLFVADDAYAATPQTNSNNYAYLQPTNVIPAEGYIDAEKNLAFTINAVEGGYTITDSYGQYIYAGSYTSVQFTTDASADILWSIEIQDDGTAKLTHISTGRYLQYSTSYKSYGMYTDAQGLMPYLYEEGATAEDRTEVTLETATSIANFYEITNKAVGAKAIIGFDLTVIAVAGKNVYVYDGTDFSCVYGTNSLVSTDVIAKGWEATYGEYQGLWEICPIDELTTTGVAGTLPEPMEIAGEELAEDLQSAYVVIPNVTVEPAASGTFAGIDENETEISFYNKFGTAAPEQGEAIYDVIGIISYYASSETPIQVYPLEYIFKGEVSAIEDIVVESDEAAVEYFNLQGVKVANPENGLYIRKQGGKATKVLVK